MIEDITSSTQADDWIWWQNLVMMLELGQSRIVLGKELKDPKVVLSEFMDLCFQSLYEANE